MVTPAKNKGPATTVSNFVLQSNNAAVEDLRKALATAGSHLREIPKMIDHLLTKEKWRARMLRDSKEIIRFETFADFIEAPAPAGLGFSFEQIRRLIRDDYTLVDRLREACGRPVGSNQHTPSTEPGDNIPTLEATGEIIDGLTHDRPAKPKRERAPRGTSLEQGIKQLAEVGRQDLIERAQTDPDYSIHAACVDAGLRNPNYARQAVTALKKLDPQKQAEAMPTLLDELSAPAINAVEAWLRERGRA